jgi:hypothetical protein
VSKIAESVSRSAAPICISHIQYLTSHLLDLGELAVLAPQRRPGDHRRDPVRRPGAHRRGGIRRRVLIAGSCGMAVQQPRRRGLLPQPALLKFRPPPVGRPGTEHPYPLDAR